jgi:hypothetical protein
MTTTEINPQPGEHYLVTHIYITQDEPVEVVIEKAGPKEIVYREVDPPIPAYAVRRWRRDRGFASWEPA